MPMELVATVVNPGALIRSGMEMAVLGMGEAMTTATPMVKKRAQYG